MRGVSEGRKTEPQGPELIDHDEVIIVFVRKDGRGTLNVDYKERITRSLGKVVSDVPNFTRLDEERDQGREETERIPSERRQPVSVNKRIV